jgi:hypothetical protein
VSRFEAIACDALVVSVVTGSPDWSVIGAMIAPANTPPGRITQDRQPRELEPIPDPHHGLESQARLSPSARDRQAPHRPRAPARPDTTARVLDMAGPHHRTSSDRLSQRAEPGSVA